MNKIILVARLIKDVEIKNTKSGKEVASFILASKRNYKNADGQYDSDFINCMAFGKTAEYLKKYSKKGDTIAIEGNLQTGNYEKDGKKVYFTTVMVEETQIVSSKLKEETKQENKVSYTGEEIDNLLSDEETNLPF